MLYRLQVYGSKKVVAITKIVHLRVFTITMLSLEINGSEGSRSKNVMFDFNFFLIPFQERSIIYKHKFLERSKYLVQN